MEGNESQDFLMEGKLKPEKQDICVSKWVISFWLNFIVESIALLFANEGSFLEKIFSIIYV